MLLCAGAPPPRAATHTAAATSATNTTTTTHTHTHLAPRAQMCKTTNYRAGGWRRDMLRDELASITKGAPAPRPRAPATSPHLQARAPSPTLSVLRTR